MPKIKKLPEQETKCIFESCVKGNMPLYGYRNLSNLAKSLHIGKTTLYEKMSSPYKFDLGEFTLLARTLHFSDTQILSIIKGTLERSQP